MIKITQIKSSIGQTKKQKETLKSLGLRGIRKSVEIELNPSLKGMVDKISHLVTIEEI